MITEWEMYNSAGNVVESLYNANTRLRYARMAPSYYNDDVIAAQVEVERAMDTYAEAEEIFGFEIMARVEDDFYEWLSESDLRKAERGYF